mmetsp:Transcript_811/g.3366  ORF Transcript_811/g.3366 Transcript_811/m.3366 type:complete len:94 (-) Transcript_811:351-632(-)
MSLGARSGRGEERARGRTAHGARPLDGRGARDILFLVSRGRVFRVQKRTIKMRRGGSRRTSVVRPIISAAFRLPSSVQIFATTRQGPRRDPRR